MDERCPCDCKTLPEFTEADVFKALNYLTDEDDEGEEQVSRKRFWTSLATEEEKARFDQLRIGMNVELKEHCDVTRGDAILTARIALAHLTENPSYYSILKKAGL